MTFRSALRSALGLTVAASTAATAWATGSFAIVGGSQPTEPHPWMAFVQAPDSQGGVMFCGGTQISRDIVLTAAHCLEWPRTSGSASVIVRLGGTTMSEGVERRASQWVRPDSWYLEDWAVLKLDRPYDNTQYAQLASSSALDDAASFRTFGWGQTGEDQPMSTTLLQVDVPFVPDADAACDGGDQEICAGDLVHGGVDTCNGDSGGPLTARDAEGSWYQVGITSWGTRCAAVGQAAHYAQLSTYLPRIQKAIGDLGGAQPRTQTPVMTPHADKSGPSQSAPAPTWPAPTVTAPVPTSSTPSTTSTSPSVSHPAPPPPAAAQPVPAAPVLASPETPVSPEPLAQAELAPAAVQGQGLPATTAGLLTAGSRGSDLQYLVQVPSDARNLTISLAGGQGDADLSVRQSAPPTDGAFECRPYRVGNTESCSQATPSGGTYYIRVTGWSDFSDVALSVTWTSGASAATTSASPTSAR